jgi:hypothetical protein
MEAYYARNDPVHNEFVRLLRNPRATAKDRESALKAVKALGGTQWSMHIYNIAKKESQCPNACRYCYMIGIRHRFWGADLPSDPHDSKGPQEAAASAAPAQIEELRPLELDDKKIAKKWSSRAVAKLIMMPSSHDIVPSILPQFIATARAILAAGHSLLIVTKPREDCVIPLDDALAEYRARIIYRLTITSTDPAILAYWEPRAATFDERLRVLRTLHERGCITSVSIEPMLSDPRPLIAAVRPFVSETIWIGTMSGKQDCSAEESARLAALTTPSALTTLARELIGDPRVRFKTHIMEVVIANVPVVVPEPDAASAAPAAPPAAKGRKSVRKTK